MRERAALNLLLVVVAAIPLVGAVGDFVIAQGNNALRAEVSRRQHEIAEAARLVQVNQALIRQIALTAIKEHDAKLRDLLNQNGITVNFAPEPPAGPTIHG